MILGLCHCGCGEKTRIATRSSADKGWIKGQPLRFIQYHLKQSEETRARISKSLTGYKKTKDHLKNISAACMGREISTEARQKISDTLKGNIPWNKGVRGVVKYSEKTKLRMRGRHAGENHYNWKGGVTPEIRRIRNSTEYKVWRLAVFERDGFRCQMPQCDQEERYLHAHHTKTFSERPDLRFDVSNGVTLCKTCHNGIRGQEQAYEDTFKRAV